MVIYFFLGSVFLRKWNPSYRRNSQIYASCRAENRRRTSPRWPISCILSRSSHCASMILCRSSVFSNCTLPNPAAHCSRILPCSSFRLRTGTHQGRSSCPCFTYRCTFRRFWRPRFLLPLIGCPASRRCRQIHHWNSTILVQMLGYP